MIFTTILLLGFAVPVNQASNWYQQFMPNLGGRSIQDIEFKDSLTGYSTARQTGDTSYFLRTTNSGDNWQIIYRSFLAMTQIQFINAITGYSVGAYLFKTTNSGINWSQVTAPSISPEELYVLNEDTIWIISSNSLTGGVFRTTNGGASWEQQLNIGSQNPNHVYFYNGKLGFICEDNMYLRRTSDGGANWQVIAGAGGFTDMHFVDTLTGWKTSFQKTTDGGLSWINQTLPQGGNIILSQIDQFSVLGSDTIWGVGGYIFLPGQGNRGIIYRSTNGGNNWLFQIPDTSIHIGRYLFTKFIGQRNGWAYTTISTGIHTTSGGDPVWITGIEQVSTEIPKEYKLFQNYPNPFNPRTVIPYKLKKAAYVRLIAYEITGKETQIMVNQHQSAGEYEVDFIGKFAISSGIYFYRIEVTEDRSKKLYTETKKMILLK